MNVGRPVFQQLDDGQHGGHVFVIGAHRLLEPEYVGQVFSAQIVRKQTARRVGIADVHVAVDETRRQDHPRTVNRLAGHRISQLGGFADLADAVPSYDN